MSETKKKEIATKIAGPYDKGTAVTIKRTVRLTTAQRILLDKAHSNGGHIPDAQDWDPVVKVLSDLKLIEKRIVKDDKRTKARDQERKRAWLKLRGSFPVGLEPLPTEKQLKAIEEKAYHLRMLLPDLVHQQWCLTPAANEYLKKRHRHGGCCVTHSQKAVIREIQEFIRILIANGEHTNEEIQHLDNAHQELEHAVENTT
jgi:hypothetical protein